MANAEITFDDLQSKPVWMAHDSKKAPINPRDGGLAQTTNPATWGTRKEAEARNLAGVGIALGPNAIGDGKALYAVDLDGCRDPKSGEIASHARSIVEAFGSYTEISPSGTGLKIFFIAEAGHKGRAFSPATGREVKLMAAGQYSTVTGLQTDASGNDPNLVSLVGHRTPIREVANSKVLWLTEDFGPKYKAGLSGANDNRDESGSGHAFRLACKFKHQGRTEAEFHAAIAAHSGVAGEWWARADERQRARVWQNAKGDGAPIQFPEIDHADRTSGALKITPFQDCSARSGEQYLAKGLLAPGDLGAIIGPPGAGKSVIAPYLGYRLENGERFFGMKVRQAKVLYVAAEDPAGLERRLTALREKYGSIRGPSLVTGVHDLKDKGQLEQLAAMIRAEKPGLVIFDTLADSFPGLDENSAESMGAVVKIGRAITRLGPAVIFIHHTTKANDGTPRGHSVFNGALDVSLLLKGADSHGVVHGQLMKNRNGPCDARIAFRILSVPIGTDIDGDPITAACGEESSAHSNGSAKLTGSEEAALQHLSQLLAEAGGFDGHPQVLIADWREACVNSRNVSAAEVTDSRRKAFDRAMANLSRKGFIVTDGDFCGRPHDPLFSDLGESDDE